MSLAHGPGMGAENPPIPLFLLVLQLCNNTDYCAMLGGLRRIAPSSETWGQKSHVAV